MIRRTLLSLAMIGLTLNLTGCPAPLLLAGGAAAGASAIDRRSAGTIVDDQAIELKVNNAIYGDDKLKKEVHINITCYNGAVLLTGEAPTEELRTLAVEHARGVEHVKRVYNEIIVGPQSTGKSRSQDTWLTTRIKTRLVGARELSAIQIKVVTENQTVFLLGIVSHAEADIATDIARRVEGVAQVVKLFEYTD